MKFWESSLASRSSQIYSKKNTTNSFTDSHLTFSSSYSGLAWLLAIRNRNSRWRSTDSSMMIKESNVQMRVRWTAKLIYCILDDIHRSSTNEGRQYGIEDHDRNWCGSTSAQCKMNQKNYHLRGSPAELTTYRGGLLICSWKPDFLHVDTTGIPVSGVNEKMPVLDQRDRWVGTNGEETRWLLVVFRTDDNSNRLLHQHLIG